MTTHLNGWGPMLLAVLTVLGSFLGALRWIHEEMEALEGKIKVTELALLEAQGDHRDDMTAIRHRLEESGWSRFEQQRWINAARKVANHPIPDLE